MFIWFEEGPWQRCRQTGEVYEKQYKDLLDYNYQLGYAVSEVCHFFDFIFQQFDISQKQAG